MKAKLIYSLPGEEKEFNRASKATDLVRALNVIDGYLRGVDKYETGDDIEKIRSKFFSILSDYDINLDNLIE